MYLSLHCHHQNDSCIKMGSDGSHFNVSVGSDGQSHKTVHKSHPFWREKECVLAEFCFVFCSLLCCCWSLLYSAILRSPADSLRSHVILHEWLAFYGAFFWISTEVVYLQRWHGWCRVKLLPSRRVLCAPYNHAPCHLMQSHIRRVWTCLAVTCHLHFWQNDQDLLCATAVTRGWNGYQNKSRHRKLTLEKKILPPLLQGFEPATFQSWVRCSNHWAYPRYFQVC